MTLQLGTYPVVVARGSEAVVRALHNVYRHRGQRICSKPSGQATKLVCPYHQWAYETDGRLLWAHDMGADFQPAKHGPKPVHCAEATGMVYICLADAAPDFAEIKAAANRHTARHQLADMKQAHR